jgi:hypothetical protein
VSAVKSVAAYALINSFWLLLGTRLFMAGIRILPFRIEILPHEFVKFFLCEALTDVLLPHTQPGGFANSLPPHRHFPDKCKRLFEIGFSETGITKKATRRIGR